MGETRLESRQLARATTTRPAVVLAGKADRATLLTEGGRAKPDVPKTVPAGGVAAMLTSLATRAENDFKEMKWMAAAAPHAIPAENAAQIDIDVIDLVTGAKTAIATGAKIVAPRTANTATALVNEAKAGHAAVHEVVVETANAPAVIPVNANEVAAVTIPEIAAVGAPRARNNAVASGA